jgi:hypothetical protein
MDLTRWPVFLRQDIGRIYKSVVRELKLEQQLGNKQLEGSHPHSYMRRFMSQLSMMPKEYMWGEQLALALLPQVDAANADYSSLTGIACCVNGDVAPGAVVAQGNVTTQCGHRLLQCLFHLLSLLCAAQGHRSCACVHCAGRARG